MGNLGNPVKGEVSFSTTEGETYTLLYSYDTLVVLEERFDKGIMDVVAMIDSGRLGPLRAVFWAGLRAHHPGVREIDAGEIMLHAGGAEKAGQLIIEAMEKAFPKPAEAAKGEAGPRKAPAASPSKTT